MTAISTIQSVLSEEIFMPSDDRVRFEQPDLNLLRDEYTVVDMHFHSHYSDGLNRIDKIAARARRLGIGIAITDHNDIRGALEIDQFKDVLSIPGIELTSAEGSHLLVYFYQIEELRRFFEYEIAPFRGLGIMSSLALPMSELITRARRYNSVIIFPHPYCAMYTGVCNLHFSEIERHHLFNQVDGVEVINANLISKWNLKCTILGFNLRKTMVGGSDGHALSHMGSAVSYARCDATRHDFLDALRMKSNRVIGKEIPLLRKLTSNSLKFRANLYICDEMLEKNIRYGCKAINIRSRLIRSAVQRRLWAYFSAATR
jgi:predicted metal-dependent phosphoesterase TrpH